MSELLPCPWCQCVPVQVFFNEANPAWTIDHAEGCYLGERAAQQQRFNANGIKRWNRRASPPAQTGERDPYGLNNPYSFTRKDITRILELFRKGAAMGDSGDEAIVAWIIRDWQRIATHSPGTAEARDAQTDLQRKVAGWLARGCTGLSSEAMALWLAFGERQKRPSHPYDPDDLDRCLRLLNWAPELREHLPKMSELSPTWAALVARWDEVEGSHLEEVGLGWSKARSAPKTYALMQEILDAAQPRQQGEG